MSIAEKLNIIAENEQKVYDAGKQAEYDAFWDMFQINGERRNYGYAFLGGTWNEDMFQPKYDMNITVGLLMFAYNGHNNGGALIDIKGLLERAGVTLDTSNCSDMKMFCYIAKSITRLPVISFESCTNLNANFYQATSLKSIDKLILKSDGTNTYQNNSYDRPFFSCNALEHMPVEGVIGQNGFDVHWSTKLDRESIISIINALSTTTTGLTVTLSKTAVNNAFGINVDDPTTYPEGSEWYELRNSKSNWTISFA